MRFFSNEAKETDDEHENDADRTEGTTVPQQRSGSPWSDTPGSASDSSDDVVPSDDSDLNGSDALRTDDSEVRHDGDDLVRDDDSPRAGDHDDLDLPLDGRTTTDEDRSGDELAAGSHRADDDVDTTDAPVDATEGSVYDSTTTTYGPDGSVTTNDEPVTTDDAVAEPVSADTTDDSVAEPLSADTTGDGDRTDDERDVDEATPVVATAPVETTTTSFDDATVADPTPVDAPVDDTAAADDTATDADAAPAVAAVPVDATATPAAAKPDPSANPVGDKLFTDGDSFNERLRDITFNFVDDPKDATAQAGSLVDEAIDKVTSALKAQKDALAAEGDDTEKLRVELRGYRDILQRLTAL